MTDDAEVARGEDQVSSDHDDMSPKGGKGPTRASAADTPGAFGDALRNEGEYDSETETLLKGAETVGGETPSS